MDGMNSLPCWRSVAEVPDARHASEAGLANSAAGACSSPQAGCRLGREPARLVPKPRSALPLCAAPRACGRTMTPATRARPSGLAYVPVPLLPGGLTVVGRERSHARRERSRNPRPRAQHCQRVRYPRSRWRERTRGRPCGAQTRGISPDESLLRDTRRRVCWTSATRGQRADEDRGSQGFPGVDDRSCSG
jgi:hypothetical protein